MKKKNKLNSLVTFAGIIYVVLIASFLIDEWEDAKIGFIQGFYEGQYESKNHEKPIPPEVYYITVEPKGSVFNFPESIYNLKSNSSINTRYFKMKAAVSKREELPNKVKVLEAFQSIFSFLLFGIYIWIPFVFYRILNSLKQETIFDEINIKRIKKIGKLILSSYLVLAIFNTLSYEKNKILFDFTEYKVIREHTNLLGFLFGLIILIVAEMISRGVEMKKEQELTI